MADFLKLFGNDRLIRDHTGKPLGRVVFRDQYDEGKNVAVSILEIPKQFANSVKGLTFYIDGQKYRITDDLADIRIGEDNLRWLLSNLWLEKIEE